MPPTLKVPSSSRSPSIASISATQPEPKWNAVQAAIQHRKSFGYEAMERLSVMYLVSGKFCPMAIWTFHHSGPRTIAKRCTLKCTPVWQRISSDRSFRVMWTCEPVRNSEKFGGRTKNMFCWRRDTATTCVEWWTWCISLRCANYVNICKCFLVCVWCWDESCVNLSIILWWHNNYTEWHTSVSNLGTSKRPDKHNGSHCAHSHWTYSSLLSLLPLAVSYISRNIRSNPLF